MPGHELPLSRAAAGQVRDGDAAGLNGRAANTCPAAYRAADRALSFLAKMLVRGPPKSDVGQPAHRGCHIAMKIGEARLVGSLE